MGCLVRGVGRLGGFGWGRIGATGEAVGGLSCAWVEAGGEERAGIGEVMRGGSMAV